MADMPSKGATTFTKMTFCIATFRKTASQHNGTQRNRMNGSNLYHINDE